MKIHKTELPKNSKLNINHKKYDYVDSFKEEVIDSLKNINSDNVAKAFFSSSPKWVGILFILRNEIVGIFGLKTSGKISDIQKRLDNFKYETNERLGLFKVFSKTENEIIMGEEDKHLNFKISLLISNLNKEQTRKEITISTAVEFNNWFGKLYFLPVKPLHKLIVPAMLKGMVKQLAT